MMDNLLEGAWDLHFHTSPDVTPRKYTDLELAEEWKSAGMKGGVIKCHYADTTGRAALLRTLFPDLVIHGGLALNRQAGGINPAAAERMAQAGGRFLWFPTLEAREYQRFQQKGKADADLSMYLSVCDEEGKLFPEVYEVLEVAAKYRLVVGTGHLGEREGMPLVKAAFECGVEHVVLTHAENPTTSFSIEAQRACVKMGAFVEHSFLTAYNGRVSLDAVAEQIRAVGAGHCILVTDFGQVNSPGSAAGQRAYAEGLMERGISLRDVWRMMKENPGVLMGVTK